MNLKPLQEMITGSALESLLPFTSEEFLQQIRYGDFPKWRRLLSELPVIEPSSAEFGSTVRIGDESDSDPATLARLREQLLEFIPWRKGPFELFDIGIDTEWQSNLKWDRLIKEIAPLRSRRVLDVGSGNGYYGFRMLEQGAEMVLGIDPHMAYVAQFWLLKHFTAESPVFVLPLTLEQVPPSLSYFDTVFSMGVIYHRRSPIDHILELKSCLRPGGELVIESICVDGETGYSLTPEAKYARMGNVWFVPSIPTLVQWLSRCGMEQISVIDESTTTIEEQRKTEWMPFDSLEDALDKNDPQLTIEGLPAPKRVVIKASRP
ncbi:MAG: tRNA U34 carboxymethyltransferase [Pseudohongiella sp.]|nr:MAG: tRNA U34 carboxymethyltransferase [Pseudohongiella sp.]